MFFFRIFFLPFFRNPPGDQFKEFCFEIPPSILFGIYPRNSSKPPPRTICRILPGTSSVDHLGISCGNPPVSSFGISSLTFFRDFSRNFFRDYCKSSLCNSFRSPLWSFLRCFYLWKSSRSFFL